MKHPVKTLAALAILGAVAPSAHAVSLKDDVLSITPGVRIQSRMQMNDATNATGDEYRVQGGVDGVNDPLDFSIRRARLYMSFKYGSNWKGQLAFNADNIDAATGTSSATRAVQVRYAWLERGFDLGEGMNHAITFGLNKPYNNPSSAAKSSSRELFPNGNAASGFVDPRGVGIGYRFKHPLFLIAADLQNNTTTKVNTGDGADEEEGFFYGVRAEFSFSPEWFIAKRAESFLAKEGQGLNVGLSYGSNQDAVTATNRISTTAYGVDVMFWLNGLSAYAEYRLGTTESEIIAGGSVPDVDAEYIVLQAGYAFPLEELGVIEPALRYQIIDTDADDDNQATVFGNNSETGAAGSQIDLGVNLYLSGHDNKLQLALSLWEAEDGDGDATIVRLQHQINF